MITATTKLRGTASDVVVAKVATWAHEHDVETPVSDEQAFESNKSGIDALPEGVKMMLNSAECYGKGWTTGNLELLARFFEKYPGYADKTFVKGGAVGFGKISGKADDLRNSVNKSIAALRGTKKIDMFVPARVDPEVHIEETVRHLVELLKGAKFDHIGLSECRADTMRHGHSVYRIPVVDIEVSPMSYEEETKKVLAASAKLGIAVAAYSLLGHGLITGKIKGVEDLPEFAANLRLIDAINAMAAKKNCIPGQLSIAWVGALGEKVIPSSDLPVGRSRKERTLENLQGGEIMLSKQDMDEFAQVLDANPVQGDRYFGDSVDMHLWG